MLSWFAITYNTARLGFEAQNAAALRLLRLAGGLSKAAANEINLEQIKPAMEAPPSTTPIAPKRRRHAAKKSRHAAKKIGKKSAPIRKRGKRAKRRSE
jgi:hypothetical protein